MAIPSTTPPAQRALNRVLFWMAISFASAALSGAWAAALR